MKIGIISSGTEMLSLFKFLSKYDNEYYIYYDFLQYPYGEKPIDKASEYIEQGIKFLLKQGVEKIILPPTYELLALDEKLLKEYDKTFILPLFKTYIQNICFRHSLIGKIGIIGDFTDVQLAQDLLNIEEKSYNLNDAQRNIKGFKFPFSYRAKEVNLWKYLLNGLSYSSLIVNKIIKFDLRYFKDAMVDTVIPFNYSYFRAQKTITKFFNFKKIKFHSIESLENVFINLINDLDTGKRYEINLFYTGTKSLLEREKKLMRSLSRGKQNPINFVDIN